MTAKEKQLHKLLRLQRFIVKRALSGEQTRELERIFRKKASTRRIYDSIRVQEGI